MRERERGVDVVAVDHLGAAARGQPAAESSGAEGTEAQSEPGHTVQGHSPVYKK